MSTTSLVAKEYRLHQWVGQIQDCQMRPKQMSVDTWCTTHGITKANYYYRLRCVREACLESSGQEIVALSALKKPTVTNMEELQLTMGDVQIHVNSSTSVSLLKNIIQAVRDAE